jgi:mRNA interferase RelE/StbE
MSFTVELDNQPSKFLRKLERNNAFRIIEKIEKLKSNPTPQHIKTIVGEHGIFRIRVGDFRVLYRVNYQENRIVITMIDKRERIY